MGAVMIVGTGTDIVETGRVRVLIDRYGERFLRRWFAAVEIEYCRSKAKPYLHFAARLAAKEAAFKALRIPTGPACWRDIVVETEEDGHPRLVVSAAAAAAAERVGAERLHLTLSHCNAYAVATVTAERIG